MIDIITHTTDTAALVAELQEKLPAYINIDADGNPIFLVDKTPTVRNGTETLSLLRLSDEKYSELLSANLQNLTILGSFEEVFANPDLKEIYDRVYPRTFETLNFEGNTITITKPERFGAFA